MATSHLILTKNLPPIPSILLPLLLILSIPSRFATASVLDSADNEEYVIDHFLALNAKAGGRFVAAKIQKDTNCNAKQRNICPGLSVNNGTGLLQCCNNHCSNILGDRNNCGLCGSKCGFGQLCCGGRCTDIAYNVDHCGKCGKKCAPRVKCEYGVCGYA